MNSRPDGSQRAADPARSGGAAPAPWADASTPAGPRPATLAGEQHRLGRRVSARRNRARAEWPARFQLPLSTSMSSALAGDVGDCPHDAPLRGERLETEGVPAGAISTRERLQSWPARALPPLVGPGEGRRRRATAGADHRPPECRLPRRATASAQGRRRPGRPARRFFSSSASTSVALAGRRLGCGTRQARHDPRGPRLPDDRSPFWAPERARAATCPLRTTALEDLVQDHAQRPDVGGLALLDAAQRSRAPGTPVCRPDRVVTVV